MSLEPTTLPARIQDCLRFGEDFELDPGAYRLRRRGRVLKLERIPMEVLLFLVERRGEIVTREEIVARIWGKDVFLDTDNSINGAMRKIRQALKDDPEQPQFIQTITGKGYRFIAPVAAASDPALAPASEPFPPSVPGKKPASRQWAVLGVVALVLAAGAGSYFSWARWRGRPSLTAKRQILAVLPFENLTGDAGQEYFSDGITEEMITALGGLDPQHLGVIGRTSVMLYKHNPKALDQVGRELGAQYVLEGSVQRDAGHLRVTAQLIQVKDQTHLWARTYDREVSDVLALQQEITQEIADEIELVLGAPRPQNARARQTPSTRSYEAYDLYLRGRYFWNKRTGEGFRQAAEYFEQALAKDPNFARAHAGLADTYGLMSTWLLAPQNEFMPKARAAALSALKIDPTLAEAHASLALVAENYDYDWRTAENEFQRAIQLDPEYPTAHQWYAECLGWQGRFDEAFAESERARQLDPMSPIIASDYGSLLVYSRQYDRAISHYRALLDMDHGFEHARAFLIPSYREQGRFDDALREIEDGYSLDNPLWIWVAKAQLYGRWGRTAEAEHAVAQVEKYVGQPRLDLPTALVITYAGTGRKDQAIVLLEKAYSSHSIVLTSLKVDPSVDSLRADPRFQDLLRRVGLAQ